MTNNFDPVKLLKDIFAVLNFTPEQSERAMKDFDELTAMYFLKNLSAGLSSEDGDSLKASLGGKSAEDQQKIIAKTFQDKYSEEQIKEKLATASGVLLTDYLQGMAEKANAEQKAQLLTLLEQNGL